MGETEKEATGLNMKRAPSTGTVTTLDRDNIWERSQSDANLSIHKGTQSEQKTNVANVSDNSSVYWNLSCPEQGPVIRNPSMNTSAVSGFQMGLETIHQHDEMCESSSSKESLSSNVCYESNSSLKPQIHNKNIFYTYIPGSSEYLSNSQPSSYMQNVSDSNMRKSCSAIPSVFTSKHGVIPEKDVFNNNNYSTDDFQSKDSNKNASKSAVPLEMLSSHYFCESDFDDNREQIPNYQTELKCRQEEMTNFILLLEVNNVTDFEWSNLSSIKSKTKILLLCNQMIQEAWQMPNVGRDYATALCDLIRQQGLLSFLIQVVSHAGEVVTTTLNHSTYLDEIQTAKREFVLVAAEYFSQVLTTENLDYILGLSSGNSTPKKDNSSKFSVLEGQNKQILLFKKVVMQSFLVKTDKELNREFISILDAMLKHHEKTNRLVVQSGGLESLIYSCRSTDNVTLRRVAFALVNLGLFGDSDVQMTMAHYNVADWLFPLAFNNDDIIQYYACLAIVILSAHKELTQIIQTSGTMELVFSFIKTHSPYKFTEAEPSHCQGRSSKWLLRLLPLLESESVQAMSLASFHFVMEARIKQRQGRTQIFKDIGAIDILKKTASSIYKIAAQFARQTLTILGESVPFSLSHPVSIWSCEDVTNWLQYIGFQSLVPKFQDLQIDGDILFTVNEAIMQNDLDLRNGIVRLRLLREINKLKAITTYETCDPTGVYDWLKTQVGQDYCQYTYALIKAGIDRKFLVDLKNDMLEKDCLINNSVHRTRILNAIEACRIKFQKDSSCSTNFSNESVPIKPFNTISNKSYSLSFDNSVLSNHADDVTFNSDKVYKNIDVFISYRRSNGSQLASLIMVHLKLRGYRVFLDIERLPAGKFNENLLKSIQKSRNFILVLTPNCLDKCTNDKDKKDWIHKEIVCALENKCNIIPVTDCFKFPVEDNLPKDMKSILTYNAVDWVHNYQDACVDKIEFFMKNPDCKNPFSPPQMRMSPIMEQSSYNPDYLDHFIV